MPTAFRRVINELPAILANLLAEVRKVAKELREVLLSGLKTGESLEQFYREKERIKRNSLTSDQNK